MISPNGANVAHCVASSKAQVKTLIQKPFTSDRGHALVLGLGREEMMIDRFMVYGLERRGILEDIIDLRPHLLSLVQNSLCAWLQDRRKALRNAQKEGFNQREVLEYPDHRQSMVHSSQDLVLEVFRIQRVS